ncbi:Vitellogenin receptor [Eumeta japonica]|uniref:Vitellogenin receptor n=1 Tax=Eumeta variegata TaxID=151549 RepID=A0A4C1WUG3_EUMVA|nr:Vitellogenin receptor [Eumeta japonica]
MYWSDWIDGPVIMRANMDGSNVTKFVEHHQNSPTGLALDIPNERLYWVDRYIHSIMLDGSNRHMVLKGNIHHPYSLAVFENNIYWSDWASNTLQACEKFDGKNRKLLLTFKAPVFGLNAKAEFLFCPHISM